jgi:hypothetical protein
VSRTIGNVSHSAFFPSSQAVIDKDVALIEKLLAEENFKEASKVYEYGAYSRNYAQLQFPVRGLPGTVEPHTSVKGLTESGDKITGTLIDIGNKGDKTVRVLYQNANDLGTCFVGGNPEPKLDGCKSTTLAILQYIIGMTRKWTLILDCIKLFLISYG